MPPNIAKNVKKKIAKKATKKSSELSPGEEEKISQLKKRIKILLKEPGNKVCSECRSGKPKWMSLLEAPLHQTMNMLGVFCCDDCREYHKALGNELCVVKSLKVPEEWTEEDVATMEKSGNQAVNAIYESALKGNHSDKHMGALASKAFVESKYKHCQYFSEKAYYEQMKIRAQIQAEKHKEKEPEGPTTEDLLKKALQRQGSLKQLTKPERKSATAAAVSSLADGSLETSEDHAKSLQERRAERARKHSHETDELNSSSDHKSIDRSHLVGRRSSVGGGNMARMNSVRGGMGRRGSVSGGMVRRGSVGAGTLSASRDNEESQDDADIIAIRQLHELGTARDVLEAMFDPDKVRQVVEEDSQQTEYPAAGDHARNRRPTMRRCLSTRINRPNRGNDLSPVRRTKSCDGDLLMFGKQPPRGHDTHWERTPAPQRIMRNGSNAGPRRSMRRIVTSEERGGSTSHSPAQPRIERPNSKGKPIESNLSWQRGSSEQPTCSGSRKHGSRSHSKESAASHSLKQPTSKPGSRSHSKESTCAGVARKKRGSARSRSTTSSRSPVRSDEPGSHVSRGDSIENEELEMGFSWQRVLVQ